MTNITSTKVEEINNEMSCCSVCVESQSAETTEQSPVALVMVI